MPPVNKPTYTSLLSLSQHINAAVRVAVTRKLITASRVPVITSSGIHGLCLPKQVTRNASEKVTGSNGGRDIDSVRLGEYADASATA